MYKFIIIKKDNITDIHTPDSNKKLIKNLILIKLDENDNYLYFENFIVNLLAIKRGKNFYVKQKELKKIDGKYFDILYVEEEFTLENRIKFKLFFDVSECLDIDFVRKQIECPICGGVADCFCCDKF